jgi:hypothetical protein
MIGINIGRKHIYKGRDSNRHGTNKEGTQVVHIVVGQKRVES